MRAVVKLPGKPARVVVLVKPTAVLGAAAAIFDVGPGVCLFRRADCNGDANILDDGEGDVICGPVVVLGATPQDEDRDLTEDEAAYWCRRLDTWAVPQPAGAA